MKYTLLLSSVALMASAMQAIPNPIETIRIKQGESYTIYITTIDKNSVESLPGKTISVYAE